MSKRPTSPRISVVVAARNESTRLRRTVENLRATLPEGSEIVVVDDGSCNGSADFLAAAKSPVRLLRLPHQGAPRARNGGASSAHGEIIVFADAHIAPQPGWWAPLVELLADPSVGAVAPVISDMKRRDCKGYGLRLTGPDLEVDWLQRRGRRPYRVPLLPAGCWAMRRDTFQATGGFDEGLMQWGSEDTELSLRLWLLGYELWVVPQAEVAHLFQENRTSGIKWNWVLHNKLRLAFVHFNTRRIARVVEALRGYEDFPSALALTVESDVAARRAHLASRRLHDDAWFFRKFGPRW